MPDGRQASKKERDRCRAVERRRAVENWRLKSTLTMTSTKAKLAKAFYDPFRREYACVCMCVRVWVCVSLSVFVCVGGLYKCYPLLFGRLCCMLPAWLPAHVTRRDCRPPCAPHSWQFLAEYRFMVTDSSYCPASCSSNSGCIPSLFLPSCCERPPHIYLNIKYNSAPDAPPHIALCQSGTCPDACHTCSDCFL